MKAEDKELYKSELEFANSLMTFEDYFEYWQLDIVLSLMQRNANKRVIEELSKLIDNEDWECVNHAISEIMDRIKELKQE